MFLVSGGCAVQQLEAAGPRSLSALKKSSAKRDKDCEAGIRSDIHVEESTGGLSDFRPVGVAWLSYMGAVLQVASASHLAHVHIWSDSEPSPVGMHIFQPR